MNVHGWLSQHKQDRHDEYECNPPARFNFNTQIIHSIELQPVKSTKCDSTKQFDVRTSIFILSTHIINLYDIHGEISMKLPQILDNR